MHQTGHVFGRPTKKEQCYDNVKVSHNAWDTNLVKVSMLALLSQAAHLVFMASEIHERPLTSNGVLGQS